MTYSISFLLTEKYDPARKEVGLRVSISGFKDFKGAKIRFTAFPPQDKILTKTGAVTFTAVGHPGNNTLEVVDAKNSKVLQLIGSLNGNVFTEGDKGQEIIITHKSKQAEIEFRKIAKLKDEIIRLDASPKISLFFGLDPETNQQIYTKKTDKKGSFKEAITGVMSDKHEVKVLTGQMNKICSIKPPEP